MNCDQSNVGGSPPLERADGIERRNTVQRAAAGFHGATSAFAFWSGIALPGLYLPLLLDGIASVEGLAAFLGLFGLHVLALVGGRCHLREPHE